RGRRQAEPVRVVEGARPLRVLGLEREELRALVRRQLGALAGEGVDRDARAGQAAEVEVEVGEVEQRLAEGGDAAGSTAHVDGRLEVPDGRGEVALRLGDGGEVEARGGDGAGVPRFLG